MIHQYLMNGRHIVLDVYSGSIHVTDPMAYAAIGYLDKGLSREETLKKLKAEFPESTEQDFQDCFSDIDELIESKKLFTKDNYAPLAGKLKSHSGNVIKALCLLVAHSCNLACSYCFASQGHYHGESGLMSFETGKRALDFLIENSGTRRNLEVDFFGGEPLVNFQVCKDLVAYARSIEKEKGKNFRFTLTTNGVGLTEEIMDWANEECHNVVLSLDGRKEVNDRFRVDRKGKGSYDQIVPKFQRFVEKRGDKEYYMRGTFSHFNTDFTEDIAHMADELGLQEHFPGNHGKEALGQV